MTELFCIILDHIEFWLFCNNFQLSISGGFIVKMATQQPSQPIPIHNNDADELKRLRINHEAFKASYENLVLAPIDLSGPTVHRILDSACSDGIPLNKSHFASEAKII